MEYDWNEKQNRVFFLVKNDYDYYYGTKFYWRLLVINIIEERICS